MSAFEDQMDDWFDNDCQGQPSDYDGAGNVGTWSDLELDDNENYEEDDE